MGFVFQQSNLLPSLTARENVALPAWRATGRRRESLARADELLARFGLAGRADARGHVLSLGEAQRVAVARAIINGPQLVLADEPTGSLDSEAADAVLGALGAVCRTGAALLVVTHDRQVAARCTRRLIMRDGRISMTEDPPRTIGAAAGSLASAIT
jgi:ABC-type lipoprotein export system ATPase subunit